MMWMMTTCILLFAALLFVGIGGGSFLAGYLWPILVGAMVVGHIWMMFRRHGHVSSNEENHDVADAKKSSSENASDVDKKKNNSGHSCC